MINDDLGLWHAMWCQAEEDATRYRLAWLSARRRSRWAKTSNRITQNRNLAMRLEADQRQHQLNQEVQRNRELTSRVLRLEAEAIRLKQGVGW